MMVMMRKKGSLAMVNSHEITSRLKSEFANNRQAVLHMGDKSEL